MLHCTRLHYMIPNGDSCIKDLRCLDFEGLQGILELCAISVSVFGSCLKCFRVLVYFVSGPKDY